MNQSENLTQQIIATIKDLLKKKGNTYQDLADHLHLSLAAVKKIMTSQEISVSRLVSICNFIGMNLHDLIQMIQQRNADLYYFTEDQELFFSKNPGYLAFLFELYNNKLSPGEIQRKHGITQKSITGYLNKLQEMNLLRQNAKGQYRVTFSGVISWSDHGPLGRTFSKEMILNFSLWAVNKLAQPQDMFLALSGWSLTASNFEEFQSEYMKLADKYRQISSYNRKLFNQGQYANYSIMTIAGIWDEKMFSDVKSLPGC